MRPDSSNKALAMRGFTLIELIVAMAVFSIIGAVLVTIFISGLQYYSNEKSQLINQENISGISAAYEADTRKSTGVALSGSCLVFTIASGNTTYCLNATTHQYTRNNIVIASEIASVTYSITLNKIVLTVSTINDQRGISNKINLTYYLREGNY